MEISACKNYFPNKKMSSLHLIINNYHFPKNNYKILKINRRDVNTTWNDPRFKKGSY